MKSGATRLKICINETEEKKRNTRLRLFIYRYDRFFSIGPPVLTIDYFVRKIFINVIQRFVEFSMRRFAKRRVRSDKKKNNNNQ